MKIEKKVTKVWLERVRYPHPQLACDFLNSIADKLGGIQHINPICYNTGTICYPNYVDFCNKINEIADRLDIEHITYGRLDSSDFGPGHPIKTVSGKIKKDGFATLPPAEEVLDIFAKITNAMEERTQ